jgi:membrane protein DedA with SNARE-associated domain
MQNFLMQAGLAAVFLFGFLEACCVPIPSEITFGFAGVLAGEGRLNIIAVIAVGTVAELLGSLVSYSIGRVGGRPLVHRFGRYLLITRSDMDRAERFFVGRGLWAVPLGRALPVVRTFVSIVSGFIEMPAVLFGVLSLIGTAVWVSVISLIGYGVGNAWDSVAHGISVAGYAIAVLAVIGIAVFVRHRLRALRAEAAEGAYPLDQSAVDGSVGGTGQGASGGPVASSGPVGGGPVAGTSQAASSPQPGVGQPGAGQPGEAQPSPRSPMS